LNTILLACLLSYFSRLNRPPDSGGVLNDGLAMMLSGEGPSSTCIGASFDLRGLRSRLSVSILNDLELLIIGSQDQLFPLDEGLNYLAFPKAMKAKPAVKP